MGIKHYTPSQERASQILNTGLNVLITGKPGVGKTEFIKDYCKRQAAYGKRILLTASTGLAASNLEGGKTLHSALRWNPNTTEYDFMRCAELLKKTDILVVDEVSMLGQSILSHLAGCLAVLDKKPQIIMSGDFFQLPPTTLKGFKRVYPFETKAWRSLGLQPCILCEVVRQRDKEFIKMLALAMIGNPSCIRYFNEATSDRMIERAVTLCTTNDLADAINDLKMKMLPGKPRFYYAKELSENANYKNSKIEKCLILKQNMRVMSLRNDPNGNYQNGSLGTIIELGDDTVKVRFDNGKTVSVGRIRYELDAKEADIGTVFVQQFPLRGGYAITIHKSQGQTFDAININAPHCWDPGQLYVALSRARTVDGIYLMNPICRQDLIADQKVIEYYSKIQMGYAA